MPPASEGNARETARNARFVAFAIISVALSITLFFGVLEGALRAYHAVKRYRARVALPPPEDRLLVPSEDPQLVYELNPGWQDGEFSVNSLGMADREHELAKSEDAFRIAILGDSISCNYRQDVPRRDTYFRVLERALCRRGPCRKRVETLNFGVDGYSILQSLHVARTRVPRFEPDLIVVQLCLNDPFAENLYADERPTHPLRTRNFLYRVLRPARFWAETFVERNYTDQGWENVGAGIRAFGELGRETPVVAVLFPYLYAPAYDRWGFAGFHERYAELAEAAGLPMVDLYDRFRDAAIIDSRWPKDPIHPRIPGHRVAAAGILAFLEERGLLTGLRPRHRVP